MATKDNTDCGWLTSNIVVLKTLYCIADMNTLNSDPKRGIAH